LPSGFAGAIPRRRSSPTGRRYVAGPSCGGAASGEDCDVASRAARAGRPLQPVPRLLLSRNEAAAALSVSVDTFERRVQPVIKLVPCGQLLLVPVKELERWCEEHAHYMAGAT
jgi:hypothetical protein